MEAIGEVVERVLRKAREASRLRDFIEVATRQGSHFDKDSVEEKDRAAPTSAEDRPQFREEMHASMPVTPGMEGDRRPAERLSFDRPAMGETSSMQSGPTLGGQRGADHRERLAPETPTRPNLAAAEISPWHDLFAATLATAAPVRLGQGRGATRTWLRCWCAFDHGQAVERLASEVDGRVHGSGRLQPIALIPDPFDALGPAVAAHAQLLVLCGKEWRPTAANQHRSRLHCYTRLTALFVPRAALGFAYLNAGTDTDWHTFGHYFAPCCWATWEW